MLLQFLLVHLLQTLLRYSESVRPYGICSRCDAKADCFAGGRDKKWDAMTKQEKQHYLETTTDKGNKRLDFRFSH